MKKIYSLLLLPLAALAFSCSDDVIDDLSGQYSENLERYNYTTGTTGETQKLRKGLKNLHVVLADAAGSTMDLQAVSSEWILPEGNYAPVAAIGADTRANQYCATVDGDAISDGSLSVSTIGSDYYISGLLTGDSGKRYVVNYRGPLSFTVGIDDPEPSGYTIALKIDPVTVTDMTTWQTTVIPGVNKYTMSITDPNGADAAFFEAINTEGLSMDKLPGTYTIAGSPTEPWLIDNGWLVPQYGMAGGAYIVAPDGEKRYINSGSIKIESAMGITGETLYSFSGEGLGFITAAGGSGTTSFSIRFATCLEKSGTELKDLSFNSTVLGREVKYSVVLPKSFDGTRKFPVLFMLHGAGGGNNDWLNGGNIASHTGGVENEMVIVCPQGSFDGFDAFYIDGYQGRGFNYETFFFTEFLPAIDAMYCGNGKHGIAGLSMGGFGSLYYGLKYPAQFSGIYACSPAIAIEGAPNLFDMIWMPGPAPITVEIGTEDFLYEVNKGFNDAMQYSPLLPTFTYIERPGTHDWAFWSACAPKIIKFFDTQFSE